MRKILLPLFLLLFINGFSQPGSKPAEGKNHHKLIMNDSVLSRLKQFDDSVQEDTRKKEELKQIEQDSQRNMDYFLQLQREHRAREKRNAIMRIGIGVAFLILLIVGLRRRRLKK
jgi:hypothetical protein